MQHLYTRVMSRCAFVGLYLTLWNPIFTNAKLALCVLISLLGSTAVVNGQDVTLTSQADIDSIGPTLTVVNGNLRIEEAISGDITTLEPLSGVTEVTGSLIIDGNDALTGLESSWFADLETVGGISITNNPSITQIIGFRNLTSLSGSFEVRSNDGLTIIGSTFTLMPALDSVGERIRISDNMNLTTVDFEDVGFANFIGNDLMIMDNPNLTTIDYPTLDEVEEDIVIENNPLLDNLNLGSGRTLEIAGTLEIVDNAALTNLDGIGSTVRLGRRLEIINNDALTSIEGLNSSIFFEGRINIEDNDQLSDCAIDLICDGISGSAFVTVANNAPAGNCNSTDDVQDQCGDIFLTNQAEVDAFSNTVVDGNLIIEESSPGAITNLDSLAGLTEVTGNLRIADNSAITNLDGLADLQSVGLDFIIENNDQLTDTDCASPQNSSQWLSW